MAISLGHGIEATAAQLMEESTKARENGERYARMTAENAAAAVARRERSLDTSAAALDPIADKLYSSDN
jgi:hypothetical protein